MWNIHLFPCSRVLCTSLPVLRYGDRSGRAAVRKSSRGIAPPPCWDSDTDCADPSGSRRGNRSAQNDNFVTPCPVYRFEFTVNLLEFNPAYPKDPKNLGERIRKARMDRGLLIRELAALVGVSPDTIINWELRGVKPKANRLERLQEMLSLRTNL